MVSSAAWMSGMGCSVASQGGLLYAAVTPGRLMGCTTRATVNDPQTISKFCRAHLRLPAVKWRQARVLSHTMRSGTRRELVTTSEEDAMPIDLTTYADAIAHAPVEGKISVLATTGEDGVPNVGLKGSMMVLDQDHLAYREQTPRTASGKPCSDSPGAAVLYFNRERRQYCADLWASRPV